MPKKTILILALTVLYQHAPASLGQAELDVGNSGLASNPRELVKPEPQQLKVIGSTLAPQELDRAVFERLLQEIAKAPQEDAENFHVSEAQLQDIAVTLSNAKNSINDNEVASLRAMCRAWNASNAEGDARVQVALDAYTARRQFTLDFIERFYGLVRLDIEATLEPMAKQQFTHYMDDRRRRMANAGSTYSSVNAQNVRSGEESVNFHCGTPRSNQENLQ